MVGRRRRRLGQEKTQKEEPEGRAPFDQVSTRDRDEVAHANRQRVAGKDNPRILLSAGNEENLDNFMTQANQILKVRKRILEQNKELRKLDSSVGELKTEIKGLRSQFERIHQENQKKPRARKTTSGKRQTDVRFKELFKSDVPKNNFFKRYSIDTKRILALKSNLARNRVVNTDPASSESRRR